MSRIEDYAIIGDLHTAAMVGADGSIDWLCLPRFDSPACFSAVVGTPENGHWRIAPVGAARCTGRAYSPGSLILETEWQTSTGTVRVTDTMPPRRDTTSAVRVVRVVKGLSGSVAMAMSLVLRFNYGKVVPWVRRLDSGALEAIAGPDAVWLRTPVATHGRDRSTVAEFTVSAGDEVPFVLTYGPSYLDRPAEVDAVDALLDTQAFWDDWSAQTTVRGPWSTDVRASLVVLKGLIYAPTGAVTAAATTSLPEQIGGSRNWDYRYCWLRDATFTLQALLDSGHTSEAVAWRDWLLRAVAGDPSQLQIMYAVDGARDLPEQELGWLTGFEGSRPVRVGNAASSQLQLDVWGEVLDSMHLSRVHGVPPADHARQLEVALLDHLEGAWREPDNGIWEGRGPRRQFVYSKVMAWVGMDRAVTAVERYGLAGPVDRWRHTRALIHAQVCREGFDSQRGTFTQFYGSNGLDAALLKIPRLGFLPPHDPRVVGTVRAINKQLRVDGLILRYDPQLDGGVDALPGTESTFLACSFWMVDALCSIGSLEQARALFERLLSLRNDVGLLSEEYDPQARRQLGNTPQAFSHVGLVNSARALTEAGASRSATAAPDGGDCPTDRTSTP
ncbi:MAG: glycoside hydrolase family 15 protein [Dermatophilaceae bacterium]|nr:glycoside hydrolase family 15 protein [Intrasporangiaceae bacterium]